MEQQTHNGKHKNGLEQCRNVSIKQTIASQQTNADTQFPRKEEAALRRATLTMMRQFNEEKHETRTDNSEAESHKYGYNAMHYRQITGEHKQRSGTDEY